MNESMKAPYRLEYTYTRSTGPVIGQFLTGLRDGKIQGTRTSDGRVIVPATEYDPITSESLDTLVDVSDRGQIQTWSFVARPLPRHPVDHPFAWALIQLDGADTAMLHVVRADNADQLSTGARVKAVWADERVGRIQDIRYFELEA